MGGERLGFWGPHNSHREDKNSSGLWMIWRSPGICRYPQNMIYICQISLQIRVKVKHVTCHRRYSNKYVWTWWIPCKLADRRKPIWVALPCWDVSRYCSSGSSMSFNRWPMFCVRGNPLPPLGGPFRHCTTCQNITQRATRWNSLIAIGCYNWRDESTLDLMKMNLNTGNLENVGTTTWICKRLENFTCLRKVRLMIFFQTVLAQSGTLSQGGKFWLDYEVESKTTLLVLLVPRSFQKWLMCFVNDLA